jgi:hypothetical protein
VTNAHNWSTTSIPTGPDGIITDTGTPRSATSPACRGRFA